MITRQEPGRIWVNGEPHDGSVLVPWRGDVRRWSPASLEALCAASFDELLGLAAEIVVFGSGSGLRFVPAGHYRALIERRIGLETMDTAAACRTYNVLAAEGRSVLAALLVPPAG